MSFEYPDRQSKQLKDDEIQAIFRVIEETPPTHFENATDFTFLERWSFAHVRMAIAQKTLSYLRSSLEHSGRHASKRTPNGEIARLSMYYYPNDPDRWILAQRVQLEIKQGVQTLFEFEYPILEPHWGGVSIQFGDFCVKPYVYVQLFGTKYDQAIRKDFRLMWVGLQFLCRNLRTWDQADVIYPEYK